MKISIITVCFNSDAYIEKTIHSVLCQDYGDLEYLIIDGSSSDNTVSIIKKYAATNPRIRWISEPDAGIADAMNKGIALATGDVVAHLNSDDYYPENIMLSRVAACFRDNPDALWLTGGAMLVDAHDSVIRTIGVRNYSYRRLLRGNCLLHPATFLRREAFQQAGMFDSDLSYAMDYDLWLRVGAIAPPLRVDHPLACFRIHDKGLSSVNDELTMNEEFEIRKKYIGSSGGIYRLHQLNHQVKRRVNSFLMKKYLQPGL